MTLLSIKKDEAIRIWRLLEEINDLFHQPAKTSDVEYVRAFATKNYPEIHEIYYNIIWNWFPAEVKKEILGDDYREE